MNNPVIYDAVLGTQLFQEFEGAVANMILEQLVTSNEYILPTTKPQMIINASFEMPGYAGQKFYDWVDTVGTGAITRSTNISGGEVVPNSSRAASVKLIAGNGANTFTTQTVTQLVPGATYTISGYSKGDGTYGPRLRVLAGATELITWPTTLNASKSFTRFSYQFVAPTTGTITVSCYCPATQGGAGWFDDLSLVQG